MGSLAFTPVKNDILGNVKVGPVSIQSFLWLLTMSHKKVRDRQLIAPLESENLQSLVLGELETKKHTAAEGLLWLVRFVPSARHLACGIKYFP